jgi:hypothetical protein
MAISKQLKQEKDLLRDGKLTSQNGYFSKINMPYTVEKKQEIRSNRYGLFK